MSCAPRSRDCAEVALLGGNLITMDPARPRAEALAVAGGRLAAVGSDAAIEPLVCEGRTKVVRLDGGTVLPGLIDSHAHLVGLGRALRNVDLRGTRSLDEVVERVARRLETAAPGEWIRGRGWDQNDWPGAAFPTRDRLDALAPDRPIVLGRVDGHAVLANGAALRSAGVGAATPDPAGGEIVRRPDGEPTGVLVDIAATLVEDSAPEMTTEEARAALRDAMEHCLSVGLTGVHDAGIGWDGKEMGRRLGYDAWDLYRAMADAGDLKLRVYAMLGGEGGGPEDWVRRPPEIDRADGTFTLRTVKLYADGALGSRGALLLQDYADRPGHRGLAVRPAAEIEAIARAAVARGYQVAVHAIGDGGNRAVLDLYERVLGDAPPGDHRLRIEHAQILDPADIPRFAALGIVPAMQPTHATSDMDWAERRLGTARMEGAYAWRSLLDGGVRHLPLGSDFPVESANPFWGIYAAVTRQDADGRPPGGWRAHEALSPEEALRGFTVDAAHAAFQEREVGSLEAGKRADFIVVDRDPLAVPPASLRDTAVLETWVGGRLAWRRP